METEHELPLVLDTKTTGMNMKRRSKVDILAEILQIARHGEKKTGIMYKANLSYSRLEFYLRLLLDSQLLQKTNHTRGSLYRTTTKGAAFITLSKELDKILS